MRKKLLFCAAVLLLCALCAGARANGWGLKGRLLEAVQKDHTWDGYAVTGNQAGEYAVMHSQYHNALFYADEAGRLHVYTAAVYQPEDKKGKPSLTKNGSRLELVYGRDETYVFGQFGEDMALLSAQIGELRLYADREGLQGETPAYSYWAEDKEGSVRYPFDIRLSTFNIRLFPRSTREIRAINMMNAKLDSGRDCLGWGYSPDKWGQPIETGKEGTAPVYTAPEGASAWRAAKGKAAVGLKGSIWLLSTYLHPDGTAWACIRYNVSQRTQRIGYALCGQLGLPAPEAQDHDTPGASFTRVEVEASQDTWLTDDPDVSQFRQVKLPRGTQMTCMGLYGDYYAYVALEVDKNSRPTDGGAILWGFVPVKELQPMEQPVRRDVMEKLAGEWRFWAGGSQAEDYLQLNADGTFTGYNYDYTQDWDADSEDFDYERPYPGVWYVKAYNPFENLYWNAPAYELWLLYDNGDVNIKGLTLEDNGFSLTYWEGGGGYCPLGEEPLEDGAAEGEANG